MEGGNKAEEIDSLWLLAGLQPGNSDIGRLLFSTRLMARFSAFPLIRYPDWKESDFRLTLKSLKLLPSALSQAIAVRQFCTKRSLGNVNSPMRGCIARNIRLGVHHEGAHVE